MLSRFHLAYTGPGRLLRSVLAPWTTTVSTYRRRARAKEPPLEKDLADPDDLLGFRQTELSESLEDWADFEKMGNMPEVLRDEATKKRIAFKIIEKKYFHPPQEVNLLSWDAKEQIRFLHQEYPEEWTPRRISESFPISENGLKLLLKSRFQVKNLKELLKHDSKVCKNWKALKAAEKGRHIEGGPIMDRYDMLRKNKQLHLLSNAAGITGLPGSNWQQKLLDTGTKATPKQIKPGSFEAIVKNYQDQKKLLDVTLNHEPDAHTDIQQLNHHMQSNRKLLESVTVKSKEAPGDSTQRLDRQSLDSQQEAYDRVFKERQTSERTIENQGRNNSEFQPSFSSTYEDFSLENDSTKKARPRSLRRRKDEASLSAPVDQAKTGLEGTIKVARQHFDGEVQHKQPIKELSAVDIEQLQLENAEIPPSNYVPEKFKYRQTESKKMLEKLQYDVPSESQTLVEEPYLYDPEKGYQHPFGRVNSSMNTRIKVPKDSASGETVIHQDGKNVYDEDGEFLYRIP